MKKAIRKLVSSFFPSGQRKENFKLFFYNLFSPQDIKFSHKYNLYKLEIDKNLITTTIPLYHIYKDFKIYTKFHKIKNDDIVLDIGANFGFVSLYFANFLNGNGLVYSIEPDTYNRKMLNKQISLNSNLKDKIIIDDSLIWSDISNIEFHEGSSVSSSIFYKSTKAKTIIRKTISLDKWVEKNKLSQIDFIKMDIEGAEIEALKGAQNIIKKFKPNFAIASYHIVDGEPTYLKLEKEFKKLNYAFRTLRVSKYEIITFAGTFVNS